MRSVISYLNIYENREKVKRYICWLLIAIIVLISYVSPKPYNITSALKPPNKIVSIEERKVIKDEDITVTDAHLIALKYINDYFEGYQLSKFIYRNNTLMLWVYNENGYKSYNDIKYIGDLLKIRFPNKSILVVLVKSNSIYALMEYRV